jgi:hypothetical protein
MTKFKEGDRIKLSEAGKKAFAVRHHRTGTVMSVPDAYRLNVHWDGDSTIKPFHHTLVELIEPPTP